MLSFLKDYWAHHNFGYGVPGKDFLSVSHVVADVSFNLPE